MEVRKRKETVTELREVKAPEETMKPGKQKREEGFQMIKGGKGYTIADIEALPEGGAGGADRRGNVSHGCTYTDASGFAC